MFINNRKEIILSYLEPLINKEKSLIVYQSIELNELESIEVLMENKNYNLLIENKISMSKSLLKTKGYSNNLFFSKIDRYPFKSNFFGTFIYLDDFSKVEPEKQERILIEAASILNDDGKLVLCLAAEKDLKSPIQSLSNIISKIRRFFPHITTILQIPWWGFSFSPLNVDSRDLELSLSDDSNQLGVKATAYFFICSKQYLKIHESMLVKFSFDEISSRFQFVNSQLQNDKRLYEKDINSLKNKLALLQSELEQVSQYTVMLEQHNITQKTKTTEMELQLYSKQRELQLLNLKIDEFANIQNQIKDLEIEKTNLQTRLKEEERSKKNLENSYKKTDAKLAEFEKENKRLQEVEDVNFKKINQIEKENDSLKEKMVLLEEQSSELKKEYDLLLFEKKELISQKEEINKNGSREVELLSIQNEKLKLYNKYWQKGSAFRVNELEYYLKELKEKINYQETQIKECNDYITETEHELEQSMNIMREKEQQILRDSKELEKLRAIIEEKNNDLEILKKGNKELEELRAIIEEKNNDLEILKKGNKELEKLRAIIREKTGELEKLKGDSKELEKLRAIIQEKTGELEKLKSDNKELEKLNIKIEQQSEKIWTLEEDVNRNKARLFASLKNNELLTKQIKDKVAIYENQLKKEREFAQVWKESSNIINLLLKFLSVSGSIIPLIKKELSEEETTKKELVTPQNWFKDEDLKK